MRKQLGTVISNEERRKLIAELVDSGSIGSQGDIVLALAQLGIKITQATASRDLRNIGAIRGRDTSKGAKYIRPDASSFSSRSAGLMISSASSGNMVVLKTPVAAAQMLASMIDSAISMGTLKNAIGSIAGDDTVLVISSTSQGGASLAKKINQLFGEVN